MRLQATSGARLTSQGSTTTRRPTSEKRRILRLIFAFLVLSSLAACAKDPILLSASDPKVTDPGVLSLPQPFVRSRGHRGEIWDLDFDSTGRWLYSAGADKIVRVWNTETEEQIREFHLPAWRGNDGALHNLDVAPNDRWFAVGGCQGCSRSFPDDDSFLIYMVDTESGEIIDSVGLDGSLHALGFSPDGQVLATGGFTGSLRFWQVGSDGTLFEDTAMPGHSAAISDLAWFPNSNRIVTTGSDGLVVMWSRHPIGGWYPEWTTNYDVRLRAVAVSPNENWILVVTEDGRLELISVSDGEIVQTLVEIRKGLILDVRFSSDGRTAIYSSGTTKGSAHTGVGGISVPGGGEKRFEPSKEFVYALAWSGESDSRIAVATGDGAIEFRNPHSLSKTGALPAGGVAQSWLASRDDQLGWKKDGEAEVVEAFDTRRAVVVEIDSEVGFTRAADHGFYSIKMNYPNQGQIATRSRNSSWRVLQATTMKISSWSFLSSYVVAVGTSQELTIVDLRDDILLSCHGHLSGIQSLTGHRDGKILASAGMDRTLRFWNTETCELLTTFYSDPDGEWVAWTPHGYFKTSENGGALLGFLTNFGTRKTPLIDNSIDHPDHHRPDIVERTLTNGTFNEPNQSNLSDDVVEEPLSENKPD